MICSSASLRLPVTSPDQDGNEFCMATLLFRVESKLQPVDEVRLPCAWRTAHDGHRVLSSLCKEHREHTLFIE